MQKQHQTIAAEVDEGWQHRCYHRYRRVITRHQRNGWQMRSAPALIANEGDGRPGVSSVQQNSRHERRQHVSK